MTLTRRTLNLEALFARNAALYGPAVMTTPTEPPAPAPTPTPPAAGPPAPGAPTPAPPAPGSPATPPAGEPGTVADLPSWAQTEIAALRKEAAERRTKAAGAETQTAELLKAVAKAAGVALPDDKPDPEALTRQLAETKAAADTAAATSRAQAIELAAWRAATKPGANVNVAALLDSRSFVAAVATLNPDEPEFATKLDAAVTSAVAANPLLRAQAARGGADFTPGGTESAEPTDLYSAVAASYAAR